MRCQPLQPKKSFKFSVTLPSFLHWSHTILFSTWSRRHNTCSGHMIHIFGCSPHHRKRLGSSVRSRAGVYLLCQAPHALLDDPPKSKMPPTKSCRVDLHRRQRGNVAAAFEKPRRRLVGRAGSPRRFELVHIEVLSNYREYAEQIWTFAFLG